MGALRNFLSIDELKVSVIVCCLLFSFSFILYLYFTKQTVEPGLLDLVKACLYSITTINSVNAISYGYGYYSKNSGSTEQSTPTWGGSTPPLVGVIQGNIAPSGTTTNTETEMKSTTVTTNPNLTITGPVESASKPTI